MVWSSKGKVTRCQRFLVENIGKAIGPSRRTVVD
jgi:hypothetical protein